eukprot:TRINITY_DN2047_c0_g2_i1.p1 TRINITY_DN2047_c0_g2~~TRINITY_DN2047_c0_g2_i1.p1  ORF type:complete len:104 (-),score=20.28 TRINITY_DN2047_c0_g2_i1:181-492(-)
MRNGFTDVIVEKSNHHVLIVNAVLGNTFYIRESADNGSTFAPEVSFAATTSFNDWAGGNRYLYSAALTIFITAATQVSSISTDTNMELLAPLTCHICRICVEK